MKKLKNYQLTILSFILGAALGLIFKTEFVPLKLIGDVFVRLIKFAVVPLVFIAIANSFLNIYKTKGAKKMVFMTFAIFAISTILSASIGMINAALIKPGGSNIIADTEGFTGNAAPTFGEFVLNLIPTNPFAALVEGNTFHVIVVAAIVGLAIVAIGKDKLSSCVNLLDEANKVVMKYIHWIVKIFPIGVFALTATSFAKLGNAMITNLLKYFVTIIVSIAIIYIIYFIVLWIVSKGKIKDILKGLSKVWIVAFSTSSSAATLPVSMQTCDELGINQKVSRFVLPFGVTMNMNGAAQFMAVTFMFIAQICGTNMTFGGLLIAIAMITILVMATPGIPGGAMVPTTIVLAAFNIPIEYFALILGLYSIIDMFDTTLNVTGDVVTSIIVQQYADNDK